MRHSDLDIDAAGQGPAKQIDDEVHTPTLISPPESKTPPTVTTHKRQFDFTANGRSRSSEPVDPGALTRALEQFEQTGRTRERTPAGSPSRKRQRIVGDRFIPNRSGQDYQANFNLLHDEGSPATPSRSARRAPHNELHFQRTEEANRTYTNLLRSEMFDEPLTQSGHQSMNYSTTFHDPSRSKTPPTVSSLPAPTLTPSTPHKSLFTYKAPHISGHPTPSRTPHSRHGPNLNTDSSIYSLSPIKQASQKMLLTPRKQPRAVSKVPYKVLDAPDLADDFYLNLVDWGSQNILGVGLGSCVYMWNSTSGVVRRLCELEGDSVTSVQWIQRGSHIAIGTSRGTLQIWDAHSGRRLRTMTGHTSRVGSLAWNSHILTSGSRDRTILHRDVRMADQYLRRLVCHKQEVCGLRWNDQEQQLASGGNDNRVVVWDKLESEPLYRWGGGSAGAGVTGGGHTAAVKALGWSPHQRGLLASGGGTADRTIKFWNTHVSSQAPSSVSASSGATISIDPTSTSNFANPVFPPNPNLLKSIDTGSQVCNLLFSTNSNELISTHGYSQNQICVWKYPSMQQVVSLTGHTYRVLYLAMSPDGEVVVTGAGDETLRFWRVFNRKERASKISTVENWGVIR